MAKERYLNIKGGAIIVGNGGYTSPVVLDGGIVELQPSQAKLYVEMGWLRKAEKDEKPLRNDDINRAEGMGQAPADKPVSHEQIEDYHAAADEPADYTQNTAGDEKPVANEADESAHESKSKKKKKDEEAAADEPAEESGADALTNL